MRIHLSFAREYYTKRKAQGEGLYRIIFQILQQNSCEVNFFQKLLQHHHDWHYNATIFNTICVTGELKVSEWYAKRSCHRQSSLLQRGLISFISNKKSYLLTFCLWYCFPATATTSFLESFTPNRVLDDGFPRIFFKEVLTPSHSSSCTPFSCNPLIEHWSQPPTGQPPVCVQKPSHQVKHTHGTGRLGYDHQDIRFDFLHPGEECQGRCSERGAGEQADVQTCHPSGVAREERRGSDIAGHHRGQPGQPGRVPAHRVEEGVRLPQEGHPQDGAVPLKTAWVLHVFWPNHHGVKRPRKFKLHGQAIEDMDDHIFQVCHYFFCFQHSFAVVDKNVVNRVYLLLMR